MESSTWEGGSVVLLSKLSKEQNVVAVEWSDFKTKKKLVPIHSCKVQDTIGGPDISRAIVRVVIVSDCHK